MITLPLEGSRSDAGQVDEIVNKLSSLNHKGKIRVYPNPNSGTFKLGWNDKKLLNNTRMVLYDFTGKQIKVQPPKQPRTIIDRKPNHFIGRDTRVAISRVRDSFIFKIKNTYLGDQTMRLC